MKITNLILGAALSVAAFLSARADVGTLDFGATNTIAGSTTITTVAAGTGNAVKVDRQDAIGLQTTFQCLAGAETANVTLTMVRSMDGATWETTPKWTLAIAANGTNTVTCFTNLNSSVIGAAGFVKLVSIQNAATNGITNLTVTAVLKRVPLGFGGF